LRGSTRCARVDGLGPLLLSDVRKALLRGGTRRSMPSRSRSTRQPGGRVLATAPPWNSYKNPRLTSCSASVPGPGISTRIYPGPAI